MVNEGGYTSLSDTLESISHKINLSDKCSIFTDKNHDLIEFRKTICKSSQEKNKEHGQLISHINLIYTLLLLIPLPREIRRKQQGMVYSLNVFVSYCYNCMKYKYRIHLHIDL